MITKTCGQCKKQFQAVAIIEGRRVPLYERIFCLECSPYKGYQHNGRKPKAVVNNTRECPRCCRKRPVTEFRERKRNDRAGKFQCSLCDDCEEKRQDDAVQVRRTRRGRLKEMAVAYLGGKCHLCGYNRCLGSLHFHHKDQKQKGFTIGDRRNLCEWEEIQRELKKCILVCANCHGELHWGMAQLPLSPVAPE